MVDPRDRRAADEGPAGHRDAATVDVPLTGADAGPVVPATDRPADGRRLLGIAVAVGIALGAVVAVVWSAASDEGDADRSQPNTAGDQSAVITTPATLQALVTLPSPDSEPQSGDAPTGTFVAPAPEEVAVPSYPPASDVTPREVIGYDIAAAVELNDDDIARRSDTHVELGYAGYVLDVSIVRDPDNDRYLIEFESRGGTEEVIVDVATGITYVNPGTVRETRLPTDDIVGPGDDVHEFFDRLLRGPLRSDTFNAAATRGRGVVVIDGVGEAREFVATVEGELVPEWQIHAFAPVGEFAPSDRPALLQYLAYVDGQGRIVQVDGVSMIGTVPQLVRNRMTVLDEPPGIEVPDDAGLPTDVPPPRATGTTGDDTG